MTVFYHIYCFLFETDIFAAVASIYVFYKIYKWYKEEKPVYDICVEWKKWTLQDAKSIYEDEIEEKLIPITESIFESDQNENRFTAEKIPYGRAKAFISYFKENPDDENSIDEENSIDDKKPIYKNLDNENPIYFSPKMSSDENELREYGILVTTKGIYISQPGSDDIELPFEGLYDIEHEDGEYYFNYGLSYGALKIETVNSSSTSINLDSIVKNLEQIKELSLSMLQDKVVSAFDEATESYEKASIETAQNDFDINQNINNIENISGLAGLGVGLEQNAGVYSKVKNNFDGKQGHGTAAEYANNAIDQLNPLNKAEHLGSDNALNGADRILNGQLIQCKYCETGKKCIDAAFDESGKFRYDGMQIEVPHDKKIYDDAVAAMKQRIVDGQVPGESNPENAKNYVRRGHVTYLQAYNIAGSGSIESVTMDATQGIICSMPGAGITAVLTFASAVWNGADLKDAAKVSAVSGLKIIGKGAAIYTLTMQLSRGKVVNPYYSVLKSAGNNTVTKYTTNYAATTANKVAKGISSSALAKTGVGKALKLDQMTGRQVIGGSVTAAIVFGPDVCKALQGKISGKQFIKNIIIGAAGMLGASLGSVIPVAGTIAGGASFSFVAKKLLDKFIEDDAILMFRIMREEFLDIVMLYTFTKDEFNSIANKTITSSERGKILQNMYQTGVPKEYADAVISSAVQEVLSKRKRITSALIEEGSTLLLEEDKSIA